METARGHALPWGMRSDAQESGDADMKELYQDAPILEQKMRQLTGFQDVASDL